MSTTDDRGLALVHEPEGFRAACDAARSAGSRDARVALVPTMGALHRGHVALIEEAKRRASFVAVSVFVNPTQFGPNEDFARYPRTLDADVEKCRAAGASLVFAPAADAMYPRGEETRVRVGSTAEPLDGVHRPGHFEGVTTIVAKLFALAGPCVAVFGRKDYQQLQVLTRMTRDLFLPVEIVGLPTVREPDGLALSSRNAYLSAEDRAAALAIPRGLAAASAAFAAGERRAGVLRDLVRASVASIDGGRPPLPPAGGSIDYTDLADPESLRVFSDDEIVGDRALCAVALRIGKTRLIDNVVLGEDPSPLARLPGSGAGA